MESVNFTWWLWMLAGLVFLAGELLTPGGFYLIFFGAGAIAVGLLKLAGLSLGLPVEGLIFVVVSVAAMLFFRKPLLQRFQRLSPASDVDNLTNEVATALEDIPAGGRGKAELRGTSWNAENLGEAPIAKATRCQVDRVDGLTLFVRPL